MKKRILFFLSLCCLFVPGSRTVYALNKPISYINKNNVELTEKEFRFVNDFYGPDFFTNMTQDDYNWIADLDVNNRTVKIESGDSYISSGLLRGPSYSTKSKKLSIARTCSNNVCTVITNLTWLTNPNVRSYDLIGVRFHNTGLNNNTITTRLNSSNGTEYSSNNRVPTNGVGTSVKLPSGATNISIQQKIYTKSGGTVYASYQHAVKDITLSTSYNYTIGFGGYGNVFLFYSGAGDYFDGMGGVNIDL